MEVNAPYDLAVIGAGPAGSAAAIAAARTGARVVLLERGTFPRHKVCGEFVSAESLHLLESLLGHSSSLLESAPRIGSSRLFLDDQCVSLPIAPAAAAITRYALDAALWDAASKAGVECCESTAVESIQPGERFTLRASRGEVSARAVVNASGRWSRLPRAALQRASTTQREKWIGLKVHYAEPNATQSVDLYFFEGGYCGVTLLDDNTVNACAMVRADRANSMGQVFALHPELEERAAKWQQLIEQVTTAPLLFADITPVEGNVAFVGDAAGFVDPFTGDGISLALRSGTIAAECLSPFLRGSDSLDDGLRQYAERYERELLLIHRAASRFRRMLSLPRFARAPILQALRVPAIGRWAVASTRGAAAHF